MTVARQAEHALAEALRATADELEAVYDAVDEMGALAGARPVGRLRLHEARAALAAVLPKEEA